MRFRESECCIYFRCCGKCLLNVIRMTNPNECLVGTFHPTFTFFGGKIKQMIIIVIVLVFVLNNYVIWWITTVWCSVCHKSIPSQHNQTKQCQSNVQLNVSFKNALRKKSMLCTMYTHKANEHSSLGALDKHNPPSSNHGCCLFDECQCDDCSPALSLLFDSDWVNKKVILLWMKWKYSFCFLVPHPRSIHITEIYFSSLPEKFATEKQKWKRRQSRKAKESECCLFSIAFGKSEKQIPTLSLQNYDTRNKQHK